MARIPDWFKPDTQGETGFLTLQNALLPYLSEKGQVAGATNLRTGSNTFLSYDPSSIRPPSMLASEKRKMYLTKERAERALSAIARMRDAAGMPLSDNPAKNRITSYDDEGEPVYSDFNPDSAGLKYLTDSIAQMKRFGASGGAMRRKDYLSFLDSVKAMQTSQGAKDAGEYAQLANQFTDVEGTKPTTSTVGGRTVFGTASKKLFG